MKTEEDIIAIEERRLRGLDKREKEIISEATLETPLEAGRKAIVIPSVGRGSGKTTLINKILAEQGLLLQTHKKASAEMTGNAKRAKRYYIRKRIERGKPYIPAHIRAQGKEVARKLGYSKWEVRVQDPDAMPAQTIDITRIIALFKMINKERLFRCLSRRS